MDDFVDKIFEDGQKIEKACREDAKGRKEVDGVTSGEIICPVCGETRPYHIVTGYNNHLHSHCSNSGCIGVDQ